MTSVSAIIPAHNGRAFIGRAIDGVLAQMHAPDHVVVVDDASSDGTPDFVAQRYPQIKLVRLERNAGSGAARNAGIAATKGEILTFLDQDDAWKPDYVAVQSRLLHSNPRAVLSRTNIFVVDELTGRRGCYGVRQLGSTDQKIKFLLLTRPVIPTLSVVAIPRSAIEDAGGFNPTFRLINDLDLYIRLALKGGFVGTREPHCTKFVHGGNSLFQGDGTVWLSEYETMIRNFFDNSGHLRFRRLASTALTQARAWVGSAMAVQRTRMSSRSP